jgi:hypothetical protein
VFLEESQLLQNLVCGIIHTWSLLKASVYRMPATVFDLMKDNNALVNCKHRLQSHIAVGTYVGISNVLKRSIP